MIKNDQTENNNSVLADVVDNASFPMYVCDFETDEIMYLNRKAEKMTGYTKENAVGQKCYKVLMRSDSPCAYADNERA